MVLVKMDRILLTGISLLLEDMGHILSHPQRVIIRLNPNHFSEQLVLTINTL